MRESEREREQRIFMLFFEATDRKKRIAKTTTTATAKTEK